MLAVTGLLIVAGLVIWSILTYNFLVKYRNLLKEAWSGIDVQLKRRADLIPNLVEAVKGYKQFERSTLENVTALRARASATEGIKEKADSENAISQALRSIFAVAEAYPELKANNSFLDLHKNLVEIEDQLQMARRYYNGTVRDYSILSQQFPSNLIANGFRFNKAEFFEIEYATERKTPEIKI
ncbi:MAG: LemA family protein [Dehalococcoidales bacterium]|jgi:LemA protein|nr:LemA family protein [Candidatus Omnitrophota bacterium]